MFGPGASRRVAPDGLMIRGTKRVQCLGGKIFRKPDRAGYVSPGHSRLHDSRYSANAGRSCGRGRDFDDDSWGVRIPGRPRAIFPSAPGMVHIPRRWSRGSGAGYYQCYPHFCRAARASGSWRGPSGMARRKFRRVALAQFMAPCTATDSGPAAGGTLRVHMPPRDARSALALADSRASPQRNSALLVQCPSFSPSGYPPGRAGKADPPGGAWRG